MHKILLIHSDPRVSDELTFILHHSGFQVVNTSGGQQGLAEIRRRQPDLIVMAEGSHSLTGDEVCVLIRELCQAPIIILGQDHDEMAGIYFLEMGADAYLSSPLNLRELLARVRSLLRRTRASATESEGGWLKNNDYYSC